MADPAPLSERAALYEQLAVEYGAALERLANGYEANIDKRLDLLQEIHIALWRSLEGYDGRCSLRTWVYRVAHNTAISLAVRRGVRTPALVSLDDIAPIANESNPERDVDERRALARLFALIRALPPVDRQVMLLYLEELDAAAIAEVTGLSAGAVATRIHRLKQGLIARFHGYTYDK